MWMLPTLVIVLNKIIDGATWKLIKAHAYIYGDKGWLFSPDT